MKFSKKNIYICATVLTAVLSVGCSQSDSSDVPDDPGFEEGIPTEVRITLSVRSGNGTRAEDRDGVDKDPTSSVELIHDDWWIVFVNKKILGDENNPKPDIKIFTRDDVTDKVTSTPSSVENPKDGFEAETFKIIIPSGEYRIYAFANVPRVSLEKFKQFLKLQEKDGKKEWIHKTVHLSDLIEEKFIDPSNPQNDGMQWPATENIPMTGVMTKKIVKNTVEEVFNVEVVRAVAKVEFAFHNPSDATITLDKLEFSPITKDENISFVPNYDAVGKTYNNKLFDDVKETGTLSFTNLSLLLTDKSDKYNMGKFGFYCKESIPAKNGGPFTIKLNVKKDGVDKEFEYQTKTISYINRNDWILIPIKFNNWMIKWKLHFYPPIGGYPPVFNQNEDGSLMAATLTTGGEFELYPVEVSQNGTRYTVDMSSDQMEANVTSGNDLFIKDSNGKDIKVIDNPNKNVTGHPLNAFEKIITGELDPKKTGEAKIEIKFYLTDTNITDELTCTFTITRQNESPTPSDP